MTFPLSEHAAIYNLVDTRFNQLTAQIEQLRSTVMAESADLKAAVDALEASIAHEIQQLTDALGSSTELADLKAAVGASVERLKGLDTQLQADDAPAPPTS